jgi:hypothetical protein
MNPRDVLILALLLRYFQWVNARRAANEDEEWERREHCYRWWRGLIGERAAHWVSMRVPRAWL